MPAGGQEVAGDLFSPVDQAAEAAQTVAAEPNGGVPGVPNEMGDPAEGEIRRRVIVLAVLLGVTGRTATGGPSP